MAGLVKRTWRTRLSKVQGSKGAKRARRICNTVSELRTQLTQKFAKSAVRVPGSARKQDSAACVPGGFTIVELVVAMVVGAIMMSSAILLLISEGRISQSHRDLVVANAFIEQKVEALRSAGFLGLSNGTTNIASEMPTELNSPRSGSLEITSPIGGIKKVYISVTYNDQGASRTYTYTTYVGELGVGQY